MIEIINNEIEMKQAEEVWEKLRFQSPSSTPFQSYAYIESAWHNMVANGTLHIIKVIRHKDKLLQAIFPCYIDNRGYLRFINDIHTDFCSPIVLPEFEYDYHFYLEVSDYIKETPEIKGFMFDDLMEDCHLIAIMEYFFKGSIVRMTNKWSAMKIDASSADNYLAAIPYMSAKDRSKMKKMDKDASKTNFTFQGISDAPYPKAVIKCIIDYMIANGERTEAYFSDKFLSVIEYCYNAGVLKVATTYVDDEPVSANIYMMNGNEYIDWLAISREGKYNSINLLQMLEYIYNHGGGSLNFARGQYDYKIRNFKPVLHCLYRITYTKSKFGQFKNWLDATKYYLKTVVKPYVRK